MFWSSSPSDQAQSPEDIPPIDPRVVYDLEQHARRVSDNLDNMMRSLTTKLYKVRLIFYGNCTGRPVLELSQNPQLRTRGFCWSDVFLPVCPC